MPAKLIGDWSRNVTPANYRKYRAPDAPVGVWTIVIKKGGGVDFYEPDNYFPNCYSCPVAFAETFSIAGSRLTVGPVVGRAPRSCSTKAIYRWKLSGRSVTFKVIADKRCAWRKALLIGVWKRT